MSKNRRTKSLDAPQEAQINTTPPIGKRSIEAGWIPLASQDEILRRSNAKTYNGLRPTINKVLAEDVDFVRANNLSDKDVANMREGKNPVGREYDHYREQQENFSDPTALGNLRLISVNKHKSKLGHKFNKTSFLTHKGLIKPKNSKR